MNVDCTPTNKSRAGRIPLARRLTLALTTMLIPLIAVAGTAIAMFRGSVGELRQVRDQTIDESHPIELVRRLLNRADDLGESYVETGTRRKGKMFTAVNERLSVTFDALRTLETSEERLLSDRARSLWQAAVNDVGKALTLTQQKPGDYLDHFHDSIDDAAALVADLYSSNGAEVSGAVGALEAREHVQLLTALGVLILASLGALVLARKLRRSIICPMQALEEAASHFGADRLSHRVTIEGDDELSHLGQAFNSMAMKLQRSRQELHDLALHDPLTGLANRSLFIQSLEKATARARRRATSFSVLYVDLDGFKAINDTLGHEAGDDVLIAAARRLLRCVRDEDTVARLGGDEFGVVLEEASECGAAEVAARITDEFTTELEVGDGTYSISASVGSTTWTGGEEVDELIHQADAAMYAAKGIGGGRWRAFGPSLGQGVLTARTLRSELQHAVENDEFVVHYQPLVDLRTGATSAVEALVRWQHPTRGLLFPGDFLEEAEASGLIMQIDRWVMREACRQVASWQKRLPGNKHLGVCVNLSARQLQHPGLDEEVADALHCSGLAAQDLVLELTETVLVRDTDEAVAELSRLKQIGVQIALDDFGTGYSSLNYLLRFPIDIIKIDRSFVSAIGGNDPKSDLAPALVKMAKSLCLSVVAEGIEDTTQLDCLSSLDCEQGQGFYFAKPLRASELETFLQTTRPIGEPAVVG